ncbi:hypothetical protein IscW_ISCW009737 [Ixodes scapularis]|uniref:Uncharacterized protein n=1 Tax=Ixodes scapularis TaxID=6945 RepID=B7Q3R7_IXOSC|nr:hypothetical protein IscW_ISCW009737 [Ixodes scapularis]|eukprot:XP_002411365.1 hypothetical protein IscW_ISCW009737 [Ixodes scapularis]
MYGELFVKVNLAPCLCVCFYLQQLYNKVLCWNISKKKAYTSLACLVYASYDSHFLIAGYDPRAFIVNILIAILPFQLWFLESSSVHHSVLLWFCTKTVVATWKWFPCCFCLFL